MSEEFQFVGESPKSESFGDENTESSDTLLSLGLGIGDALQLQDHAVSNWRYYAKLIGFLNKEGVIVTHPAKDGVLLPVEDGKSLLVRGFSGRKTYEFKAHVLAANTVPYPHLHLTYPKKIECMTMRGALRIKPRSLVGWIEPKGAEPGTIRMPMAIVDLSTSGARVLAKSPLGGVGDEVKIMFRLPVDDEDLSFSIPAAIRQSYIGESPDNAGDGDAATYGLEFLQPEGTVRMALQGYIYRTMAEGSINNGD